MTKNCWKVHLLDIMPIKYLIIAWTTDHLKAFVKMHHAARVPKDENSLGTDQFVLELPT